MACQMPRYVQLEDGCLHETPWHRRIVWAVCCSGLCAGLCVAGFHAGPWRKVKGFLSPPSGSPEFPLLHTTSTQREESGVDNLANIMPVGRRQGVQQLRFHPRLQNPLVSSPRVARGTTIVKGLHVPAGAPLVSAEELGAKQIVRLLTWASAKIVMEELNLAESRADSNENVMLPTHTTRMQQDPEYATLVKLMEEVPLDDADSWMKEAMNHSPSLAMRLLEVRKQSSAEFDYNQLSELTQDRVSEKNRELMVDYAEQMFTKTSDPALVPPSEDALSDVGAVRAEAVGDDSEKTASWWSW